MALELRKTDCANRFAKLEMENSHMNDLGSNFAGHYTYCNIRVFAVFRRVVLVVVAVEMCDFVVTMSQLYVIRVCGIFAKLCLLWLVFFLCSQEFCVCAEFLMMGLFDLASRMNILISPLSFLTIILLKKCFYINCVKRSIEILSESSLRTITKSTFDSLI